MRNNPYYQQLRQIAFDENYGIEQVKNATDEQLKQLLGVERLPCIINGAKELLCRELQERDDEIDKEFVRSKAREFLSDYFPDFEVERGRELKKPFVKIWLKGKPLISGEVE